MDYTIAPNTTAVGSGDVAPATGTPGEFTNGDPATTAPATVLPGYQMNALVQEIRNAIVASGQTPSNTNNAQLAAAISLTRGRLLNRYVYTLVGGVLNVSVNGGAPTTVGASAYTPNANMNSCIAYVQGGGGGGGSAATCTGTSSAVGSGGASGSLGVGSYTKAQITAALVSGSIPITLGASGNGGTSGGNGGNGGTSSFGSLLSALGGGQGFGCPATTTTILTPSGPGGANNPPSGTLIYGAAGQNGIIGMSLAPSGQGTIGGFGGNSPLCGGGGGQGGGEGQAGSAAQAPGAGGGGSATVSPSFAATKAGGAGGSGTIIVEEYS